MLSKKTHKRDTFVTFECKALTQLIAGIGYSHQLGITHRDVKPKDILIKKDLDDAYDSRLVISHFVLEQQFKRGETEFSLTVDGVIPHDRVA